VQLPPIPDLPENPSGYDEKGRAKLPALLLSAQKVD
jgi:hypothetical protein